MTAYRSEDIADLAGRLNSAEDELLRLKKRRSAGGERQEAFRLGGKIEGVRLALDYLRVYEVQP